MTEDFSPEGWRREKYGDRKLKYLPEKDYQKELARIRGVVSKTIKDARQEMKDWGTTYPVVGAIIYGSWARGDVHTKSDIDLIAVTTEAPGDTLLDFEERLRARRLGRDIELHFSIVLNDRETAVSLLRRLELRENIIVSPYDRVVSGVQEIVSAAKK